MDKELIGIVGFLIVTSSTIPYAWSILKGRHDTSVTGWVLAVLTGFSLLITYKGAGADDNIWIAMVEAIEPLLIAGAAIWRRNKWGRPDLSDIFCTIVCIVSLAFYFAVHRSESAAEIALVAILLADIASSIPIVKFAWQKPECEQPIMWLWGHIGVWVSFWSITYYTWDQLSLPIYQLLIGLSVIIPTVAYRLRRHIPVRKWI